MTEEGAEALRRLYGIPVSPGIIIGKAHLLDRSKVKIIYEYLIGEERLQQEVERFQNAVSRTEIQLQELKARVPEHVQQHSFILDSHLMILNDSMLTDSTVQRIREERINAEWALKKSLEQIKKVFEQVEDDYIRNRLDDVENVAERILRNLSGDAQESLSEINQRVIIVARDLSPADTTELNISRVMGFITDVGGKTSHTAIMAQALEIPAVVALENATGLIEDGDLLIVDGSAGEVLVNPEDGAIIRFQEKQLQFERHKSTIAKTGLLPAETLDGHRIRIQANIEFLEEVAAVRDHGGEGIGLYRTEFLYLRTKGFPNEEELFEDYREVAELLAPDPVTIRTLDLGGDKFASELEFAREMNPALGLRAVRFCLRESEVFKTQLRAIYRASVYGHVQLMFPMVSGLQEILDVREVLREVQEELDQAGTPYDPDMKVGVMIEIPSAVMMADVLASHVDFFSIGTNDLIQYALAIDRINEHVAYMYQPYHPAIVKMVHLVVRAAEEKGIPVSLCGEMAGDPLCVPILLGMGLRCLSMNARAIPLIKKLIRSITLEEARADFAYVNGLNTAKSVQAYLLERVQGVLPDIDLKRYM